MSRATLYCGDVREVLAGLPDGSVQCCVTSPPYWGLRDYGVPGQLGLERTPDEYVAAMVGVFRAVRRVLRDDGVLWLNLGDSYASGGGSGAQGESGQRADRRHTQEFLGVNRGKRQVGDTKNPNANIVALGPNRFPVTGLKPKDLVGIPWAVATALRDPYYAGRIKNPRDRLWLAVMIETEGCIHIHRRLAGTSSHAKYTRADGSQVEYARTLRIPTPTASRRSGLQSHGVNVVSGQLNPTWVEWLMGFCDGWTALPASAMPSSRTVRSRSSAPSKKPKEG